jgi:hypothetical protein
MQPIRLPLQKNAEEKLKLPRFSIHVSNHFRPTECMDRGRRAGERRLPACRSRQLAENRELVGPEIRNNFPHLKIFGTKFAITRTRSPGRRGDRSSIHLLARDAQSKVHS